MGDDGDRYPGCVGIANGCALTVIAVGALVLVAVALGYHPF